MSTTSFFAFTTQGEQEYEPPVALRPRRSPSIEYARTEGAAAYESDNRLSSSPTPRHPVAVVLGMSENAVAYMPPNDEDVVSYGDDDSSSEDIAPIDAAPTTVRALPIAATLRAVDVAPEEPKAPLRVDHLFWRCGTSGATTVGLFVPLFDALIDHGAHAVLIRDSLVSELNLKWQKLPRPEEVETAFPSPGEKKQTTTLTEYVKLKLYDPVSNWGARTVRAIIAPSLCSPIILGLPFLPFNEIVVDASLRTAVCKTDGTDLLNPIKPIRKVIQGTPLTESQQRRIARTLAREEETSARLLKAIFCNSASPTGRADCFWECSALRLRDGEEVRVWARLDMDTGCNLISLDVASHLGLARTLLDAPIKHTGRVGGADVVLELTEYVTFKLASCDFEFVTKDVVALVIPVSQALSCQMLLGEPFLTDNDVVMDTVTGGVMLSESGRLLSIPRDPMLNIGGNKLPRLTREKGKSVSKVAAVRERIEVLTAEQELIDRGDQVKRDFP